MNYDEYRKAVANNLVKKFNEQMESSCEYDEAYGTLQKLMRYKLVDEDSELVSEDMFATLSQCGVDTYPTKMYDYRLAKGSDSRVPENLLFKMPDSFSVNIRSQDHWAKRREKQYVGDIIIPEKEIPYLIMGKSNELNALATMRSYIAMASLYSKKSSTRDLLSDIKNGFVKVFDIKISSNTSYVIHTLGYAYVFAKGNESIVLNLILDNKSMIEQRIDLKESYDRVRKAFEESFKSSGKKIEFRCACNLAAYHEKQLSIYEKDPVITYDEHMNNANSNSEVLDSK